MKLRRLLMSTFVIFALVPALTVFFLLTVNQVNHSNQIANETVTALSALTAQSVEQFFRTGLRVVSAAASEQAVLEAARTDVTEDARQAALALARRSLDAFREKYADAAAVCLADLDGKVFLGDENLPAGTAVHFSAAEKTRLHAGQAVAGRVRAGIAAGGAGVLMVSPVRVDGSVQALLIAEVRVQPFEQLVQQGRFLPDSAVTVFDSKGYVAATSSTRSFPRLADLAGGADLQKKVAETMSKEGPFRYHIDGQRRVGSYVRLPEYGWSVLVTASAAHFSVSLRDNLISFALSAAVLLMLMVFVYRVLQTRFNRPVAVLLEQIARIDAGDFEATVPYLGNGEMGQIGQAFNKLMRTLRTDRRELMIREQRQRILNEQSSSVIFEYNVETGAFEGSPGVHSLAGYPACLERFPDSLVRTGTVDSRDAAAFVRLVDNMLCGQRQGTMDVRLKMQDGSVRWHRLLLSAIQDLETFRPLRLAGKLTDIESEKQQTQELVYKAERDPLTGIYNKAALQVEIADRLSRLVPDTYSALFIIDLDNFKRVNDTYGHQRGDEMIVQTARAIAGCFRGQDVVGRMGGDEFMVFLHCVPQLSVVHKRAEAVVRAAADIVLDAERGETMSVSVGVAVAPTDGTAYDRLYTCADKALYCAKNTGKNGYAFFERASDAPPAAQDS